MADWLSGSIVVEGRNEMGKEKDISKFLTDETSNMLLSLLLQVKEKMKKNIMGGRWKIRHWQRLSSILLHSAWQGRPNEYSCVQGTFLLLKHANIPNKREVCRSCPRSKTVRVY